MEILTQLQQHLPPWALEFVRLWIWLFLLAAVFVPLERLFGQRRQNVFRKEFLTDLGYYFLSSLLPAKLLAVPVALVALGFHKLLPASVYAWSAQLPLWERLALAMVVGELGTYWGHRWTHQIPLLWRFHAVHHSAGQIDWLVNTRAHPFDMVFTRFCGYLPLYALGLGSAAAHQMDMVPLLVALAGTVWGFFVHANLRWRFGWLEWLIATPHFHHWHHTNDGPEFIDKNYAAMLPWMDKLFGTFYLPKQFPARYGIDGPMAPALPGQLVQPFLPRRRTGT